jgi:hypothetical protein
VQHLKHTRASRGLEAGALNGLVAQQQRKQARVERCPPHTCAGCSPLLAAVGCVRGSCGVSTGTARCRCCFQLGKPCLRIKQLLLLVQVLG